MIVKQCKECQEVKDLTLFYKHKAMADGHLNKCIECVKVRVTKHRYNNLDKITDYERERFQRPDRKSDSYRLARLHRQNNPIKYKARYTVSNALRDGRISRQPCVCGETKVEAHHTDYSRPLDVVWLCSTCHGKEHRKHK